MASSTITTDRQSELRDALENLSGELEHKELYQNSITLDELRSILGDFFIDNDCSWNDFPFEVLNLWRHIVQLSDEERARGSIRRSYLKLSGVTRSLTAAADRMCN